MFLIIALLFIFSLAIAFILIKHITQPLNSLQRTIESIEQNSDLTNKAVVLREDEFGAIANSFNAMFHTFKEAIGNVSASSEEVSEAASHSATINNATRENITAQNDQLQQLATSIEEMSASISEVAQNTTLAASSAEEADKETVQGAKLVQQTFNSVNEVNIEISGVGDSVTKLEVQGKNVTSVLEVIKSIADQTNLLALNAAIEAARAGEQGRGFAVVADEVRVLAQRTQDSTAEIESMLNQFNSEIDHAVLAVTSGQTKMNACIDQAQKATQSIDSITKSVDTIKQTSYQIASATEEQSMVTGEITVYIASISEASTNILNSAIESSSAITQQAKWLTS
jgi:methyl-accepting chemotaxis protein